VRSLSPGSTGRTVSADEGNGNTPTATGSTTGLSSSSARGMRGVSSIKTLTFQPNPPSLGVAAFAFRHWLPRRELAAGYAGVVKHGLIGDAGLFNCVFRGRGRLAITAKGATVMSR